MSWLKIVLFILIISYVSYGAEIKSEIYGEYTTQSLNKSSKFNPDNIAGLNELKYIITWIPHVNFVFFKYQ